ncbi:PAS domain S-box protein [Candidatus Parcubacteria bacterium]|nr:PAS domain S-box protein [Candidatus Parcubacteria bacterium]
MIKETQKLYKDIFVNVVSSIAIFNEQGIIEYANNSLENFSGYQLKELVKKSVSDLISEREKNRINEIIQKTLIEETNFKEFDTLLLTKEKEKIPISFSILPLKEKKKIIGGFAVFTDATQYQGLVNSLSRNREELEDKVKERTKELQKAKDSIEESKNVLEVKVKARTRELAELNQGLDKKVKARTKELQERVDELERFHKLTIGRELKMIELKQEIKRLEKLKK